MELKKLASWLNLPLRFGKFKIQRLIILSIFVAMIIIGSGIGKLIPTTLLGFEPAVAQIITSSDVWQKVYEKLPDFPKENQYISRDTGKVDQDDTLANRLIRYHIYVKGRSPIYRLDWKLTLADYLNLNETMYDGNYPGFDLLRVNPIDGNRQAIANLNRNQRHDLVQVLVNIFTTPTESTLLNNPTPTPTSTSPNPTPRGGAELLK